MTATLWILAGCSVQVVGALLTVTRLISKRDGYALTAWGSAIVAAGSLLLGARVSAVLFGVAALFDLWSWWRSNDDDDDPKRRRRRLRAAAARRIPRPVVRALGATR